MAAGLCDDGSMLRGWRRSFVLGVGSTLLAAVVLCPLMTAAAAMPAASSCHDQPAQDRHGETSPAFTCCAPVVAAVAAKAAPDVVAALPPAVDVAPHASRRAERHADHPRPRSVSPPLFVQHASLLI